MPLKAGDAERLADILEATIVAERLSLRLQHSADGDTAQGRAEIECAQEMRRNAIGLRKAIEKWPAGTPASTT